MDEERDRPLRLFEAFGVEIEHVIVDAGTLDVRPFTDRLIHAAVGSYETEIRRAEGISWSNELAMHVVELKTTEPAPRGEPGEGPGSAAGAWPGLAARFQVNVAAMNSLLEAMGARLMPGGMHPWMDPAREMKIWPHEYSQVYTAFDRVFDCKRHGWGNLQSVHLNLPFAGDEEFGRLHAAVRLLLPILPALAASSPLKEGRLTGSLDTRLGVYATNSSIIPSIAGRVIPEPVYTRADYELEILERIYEDLEPHDPEAILRHEWVNARGAIARFERSTVEVRLMDVQECPAADIAICACVAGVLEWLVGPEAPASSEDQKRWEVEPLRRVLDRVARQGRHAEIGEASYLQTFGMNAAPGTTAGELWRHLLRASGVVRDWKRVPAHLAPLRTILDKGPLAERIVLSLGGPDKAAPTRSELAAVYQALCDCLARGEVFSP